MQTNLVVLGGLHIAVEFTLAGPDKDAGIMGEYVDDWHITHIAGRKCNKPPVWLYERIANNRGEEDRIYIEMLESVIYE